MASPEAPGASYQESNAETEILLPLPKAERTKTHCQRGKNQDIEARIERGGRGFIGLIGRLTSKEGIARPKHIQSSRIVGWIFSITFILLFLLIIPIQLFQTFTRQALQQ